MLARRAVISFYLFDLLDQKHVSTRKSIEQRRLLSKVGGQDISRVSGYPLGQVNALVVSVVKNDEDARLLATNVFNRVTKPLRNVGNIALANLLFTPAALRAATEISFPTRR